MKCGYSFVGRTRRKTNQYYYCKGGEQIPDKLCDMPTFRADHVESVVWNWIVEILQNPEVLITGIQSMREENELENHALRERLSIIEDELEKKDEQLSRLLDLFVNGDFPKDVLNDRRYQLESNISDLNREHDDLLVGVSFFL